MNNINIKEVLDSQNVGFKSWLKSSAIDWKNRGDINVFYPLELMFPMDEDEWIVLAEAIENLQETKKSGANYSDRVSYEVDIISLIGDSQFFEDHKEAWEFVLKIAVELQIVELIAVLLQYVRTQRFRLFEAFDIVDHYSETSPEVCDFYENSISLIGQMPSYALRLLKKLINIRPDKAFLYIQDSNMATAIKQYRHSIQGKVTPIFEEAAKEIGIKLNDEQYRHFVESANRVGLNTLVFSSRLFKIVIKGSVIPLSTVSGLTLSREVAKDKAAREPSIQPYVESVA